MLVNWYINHITKYIWNDVTIQITKIIIILLWNGLVFFVSEQFWFVFFPSLYYRFVIINKCNSALILHQGLNLTHTCRWVWVKPLRWNQTAGKQSGTMLNTA